MTNLENVSTEDLQQILMEVEGKKPTQRLMAAINWKEEDGVRQKDIAQRYGYTQGWPSQWLTRLERRETEPFEDVVYDEPRSGRPTEFSEQEHERFVDALHEPPKEAGIDAPAWSVPLAQHYLSEEFDVDYCDRHVRRLMTEAGLSSRKPGLSTTNPMNEHKKRSKTDSKKTNSLDDEYMILAIDQTRQIFSKLIYAWFPEGKRPSLIMLPETFES